MKAAVHEINAVHSSPAIRAGQLVFTSGFLGVSPNTGRLVSNFQDLDDEGKSFATGMLAVDAWIEGVGAQFWQASRNLKAALEAEGSSIGQVVLFNFYSMQMHHHHLINTLRSTLFRPTTTPPNTGMQVAANPAGALMQAAAIGFVQKNSEWQRRIIKESAVSQAMSAYDLGVQIGPFLFTGDFVPGSKKLQRAIDSYVDVPALPETLRPADLMRESSEQTIRSQTWFLYENIRDVLTENDAKLDDIVKLRVYLTDMRDVASFSEIHQAFFGGHRPVVVFAAAVKLGRPEFRVAIEVTAVVTQSLTHDRFKPRFIDSTSKVFSGGSAGVVVGPYVFLGNSTTTSPKPYRMVAYEELERAGLDIDLITGPAIAETWEALQHGSRLLQSAGASLGDVVSLSIYLISMDDLHAVNRVLKHVFPVRPPAVTVIQVPGMPVRGTRIEIEITAYRNPAG